MKKVSRRSANDLRIPVYSCTVYQKHFFFWTILAKTLTNIWHRKSAINILRYVIETPLKTKRRTRTHRQTWWIVWRSARWWAGLRSQLTSDWRELEGVGGGGHRLLSDCTTWNHSTEYLHIDLSHQCPACQLVILSVETSWTCKNLPCCFQGKWKKHKWFGTCLLAPLFTFESL